MHFSVATNFDDDLPGLIAPYGAVEVFGKLPKDNKYGRRIVQLSARFEF